MGSRRFHRDRKVRLHASGRWVVTIGRTFSRRSGKLVDKDWYFEGSQAQATENANAKARQWELLCTNWERTERPTLELLGEPLPHEPRWPTGKGAVKSPMAAEVLQEIRREGVVSADEVAQAYSEFSFPELIPVYEADREEELRGKEVQNSTVAKDVSQMKQAASFLPSEVAAVRLTGDDFRDAKKAMLAVPLKRRTVRNYLGAAVKLLRWVYGRYGGNEASVPPSIEEAIVVRGAVQTQITVHTVQELKTLFGKVKGTLSELDALLALNCGMYPEDIGRLLLEEIDFAEGSVFWDREKEPGNPFRIYHLLWPETLAAAKRFLNDGRQSGVYDDYRHAKGDPTKIDARDLAFLDRRRPRYLMKPGGSAYDLVGRRWSKMKTGVMIRNLRKSTNELLVNLVTKDESDGAMLVAEELSSRFLGQKSDLLVRLYRTSGKAVYARMNRFLLLVGDHLRAAGVFDDLNQGK